MSNNYMNCEGFDPPFPDNYVQTGSPRRYKGSNNSIAESKTEKFKKLFFRNKDEQEYETETEADIYEKYDMEARDALQLQQSYPNNNYRNSGRQETGFTFGNGPQDTTARSQNYNLLQESVKYLDSPASNETFLTSNRLYHEPFNVADPISRKQKKTPNQKDMKSPVVVVSSRHNILNNIHSALTDPHMSLKIGPTKFSDVCWRLESYVIKKKQGIKLLQKAINDFKAWTPQGDVLDPEDVSSMSNNFIELMENELEYELKTIRTLESTLSILKTVSSKEDRYLESQKQLKTTIKKYNDSKVKKNSKSGSNSELLRSEYKDSQRRYSTEQKILQESISVDLRKQYIFHNYYNFANSSSMIDKSKENVRDGLKILLKVDDLTFQQTFGDIRQQRMSYNWNHLTTEEQENTRRQDNFQNGLVDKNDTLLGYIYKDLPVTQVQSVTCPRTDTVNFQFVTGLGNENNETPNITLNGTCRNNLTTSAVVYKNNSNQSNHKTEELHDYSVAEEIYTSCEGTNKENKSYRESNKENDTIIQNVLLYPKRSESDINGCLDRSIQHTPTNDGYEINTLKLTTNYWTENNN